MKGIDMAKAVRIGTWDVPLDLDELSRLSRDEFSFALKDVAGCCEQWEQGLISDDEMGWTLQRAETANRQRRAVRNLCLSAEKLGKRYGLLRNVK